MTTFAITRVNGGWSLGKKHFEVTVNVAAILANVGVGLDDGREGLNAKGGAAGAVVWYGDGSVSYNGTDNVYTVEAFVATDVLTIEVNIDNALIFFKRNSGNWNNNASANPTTGVGGLSISAVQTPMRAIAVLSAANDQVTGAFDAGSFSQTPSSGYSAWSPAPNQSSSLVRQTTKLQKSTTQPPATIIRKINKGFQSSAASIATLVSTKVKLQSVFATATAIASIIRQTGKSVQANSSPAASQKNQTSKPQQASGSPQATLSRQTGKPEKATTSPVATITTKKAAGVLVQASAAAGATMVRRTGKLVSATANPVANISRFISKSFFAATSPIATLVANIRAIFGKGSASATDTLLSRASASDKAIGGASAVDSLVSTSTGSDR